MKRLFQSVPTRILATALISLTGLTMGCTQATAIDRQTNAAATPTSQKESAQAGAQDVTQSSDSFGLAENMPYEDARHLLMEQNWEPHTAGDAPNLNDSTVEELFELGYPEVKDCSGTGLGPCRFEFVNADGEIFVVTTIQNGSGTNLERFVSSWFFEQGTFAQNTAASETTPPFFGERYFNFYGGNGTGQSITIESDGATTVRRNGTVSSSVIYRGQFSNPIMTNEGEQLRIDGDNISLVSADGQVIQGCKGENAPCESDLYEATTPAFIPDGYYVLGGTDQGLEVSGDQYRYYDELGTRDWRPLSDLTLIQEKMIFDGDNYWCMPPEGEPGVCTENGWQSIQ
ncbi:hypothetical protein [Leptothoe sp. PORK10 BA2]|uniref:hypothetical protein n=1 Tax=Leptothoe sp. PORK10 BA2 TaxID=3110254 RepID=UPI002B202717|nr:hypothetical protein [Leptothoe sp. PORK10 BA2]MEA5467191.1 hypothetical protein [Leptothoe sp. PORK10 BA2]